MWRNIDCRPFELNLQKFWFQGHELNSYKFINQKTNEIKNFILIEKKIFHTTNYISDTGCGCIDSSVELLINDQDTLWLYCESVYVESNEAELSEKYFVSINGSKYIFPDFDSVIKYDSILVDGDYVKTKKFSRHFGDKKGNITFAEGIGIVSMNLGNGEIWEIKKLKIFPISTPSDYRFKRVICD